MTSVLADDRLFEVEMGEAEAPRPEVAAGEAKTFRRYDRSQCFLLPPSLDDWLDEDDEARFVSEVVEELLDLSPIYSSYKSTSGAPPYDPRMMLKLLVYGYSIGVTSSREIERRCRRDVAFRWLSANETPDFRSVSRFRRRHLEALRPLFLQVLGLCAKAGLVRLGRVALDGTKLDALQAEVDAMLVEAEATDQAEDEVKGVRISIRALSWHSSPLPVNIDFGLLSRVHRALPCPSARCLMPPLRRRQGRRAGCPSPPGAYSRAVPAVVAPASTPLLGPCPLDDPG